MSSLCNCIPVIPPLPALNCDREQKPAGIDLLILKLCSYLFTDPTDITEWQTAVQTGNVILIPHAKIIRPAPTQTTATDANGGSYVTGEIHTLTVEDADIPYDPATVVPAVDSRKHPLWDKFKSSPRQFDVAWLHTNNDLYAFYRMTGSTVTEQSGETALESRKFMGDITYTTGSLAQPAPIAILDLHTLY